MRRALTFNVQTPVADPIGLNAVYVHFGWGNPQNPVSVMTETGIKQFSLFAVWSDGSGNPQWEGYRGLSGATETAQISAIRAAGGDVVVTFGGAGDDNLGVQRTTAASLANAYQSVINLYSLKAIDIDLEGGALWDSADVRQRIIDGLKIVQNNNPSLIIYITTGALPNNVFWAVRELMQRGATAQLDAIWVGMPFDFGPDIPFEGTMGEAAIAAMEPFKEALQTAYGYDSATAYRHVGISSMNGITGGAYSHTVTMEDFELMLAYSQANHLGRFTFWSVNRDRSCDGTNNDNTSCSGISQAPYDFTKLIASYHG